MQEHKNY